MMSSMRTQPIYDYVIDQLELSKGRWSEVAIGSGVPKRTLEKIARRETENPGVKHIQQLSDYFRKAGSFGTPKAA
jgi:hypothetical protein